MAYSLLAGANGHGMGAASGSGTTGTGPTFDSSTADLLILGGAYYSGFGGSISMIDSKSNSGWSTEITASFGNCRVSLWWNQAPASIGSGHHLDVNASGGSLYGQAFFIALAGSTSSPQDHNGSGNGTGVTSFSANGGAFTPGFANELIITIGCWDSATTYVLSGSTGSYTVSDSRDYGSGVNMGGAMGYSIQSGGPSSTDPVWGSTGASSPVGINVTFKAAAGGAASKRPMRSNVITPEFHDSYRNLRKPTMQEIMYYNKRKAA